MGGAGFRRCAEVSQGGHVFVIGEVTTSFSSELWSDEKFVVRYFVSRAPVEGDGCGCWPVACSVVFLSLSSPFPHTPGESLSVVGDLSAVLGTSMFVPFGQSFVTGVDVMRGNRYVMGCDGNRQVSGSVDFSMSSCNLSASGRLSFYVVVSYDGCSCDKADVCIDVDWTLGGDFFL